MSSSQDPLGLLSTVSLPFQPSHAGSLATNPTAPATDTPDVPRPRRKRHQSKRACAPCHDRKTACGEVRPCDRCVRLGHPELCVDFTPTRQKQTRRSQAVASSLAVFPSLPSSTSFETFTSESAETQPPKVEEPLVVVPSVPPSATPMPRFLDDEVCSVVEGLESRLSSGECSLNLIISTAYIVHEISQIAHLYWEAIRHWFESESTKAGKQLGLAESLMRAKTRSSQLSPRESPYNGMFSAISPQPSMIASTNFYLSPPRSVQETPWQCLMLAFSRAYSLCWSDPDTDLFSVSETAIQLAPSKLPSYEVPPIAHPAEKRLFSILDRWKRHRATRLYLARYVDPMRVFNLNILLEAEQVRSQFVPFGVVLVSLYPAPDMLYPRWCSPNFARALGYTPSEMRELDRTGKEGSKYLKLYPVETCRQVMCLLYTMISSGSTSWTGPIVLLNKFGCPVKFILSLSMRFQTGIPMYAVSYYQIWTPPGELAVLCHRPH